MKTSLFGFLAVPAGIAVLASACGSATPVFFGASASSGAGGSASTTTSTGGPGGEGPSTTSVTTTSSGTPTVTSSTTTTSGSSATSSSGAFVEGKFPKPPVVVDYGGPVLASPQLHAVFFSGDDTSITGPLGDFTTMLGSSTYWSGAVAEYGVGPATGNIIQLTEAAATSQSDDQVQAWLVSKLQSDPTNFPAPTGNDLYVLYYPEGVSITLEGASSCSEFGGYHNSANFEGHAVSYAVVPRCPGFVPGESLIDITTGSASHEIVEGCTDADPMGSPAYLYVDNDDVDWADAVGGGEVGDMCAQTTGAFVKFPGLPYLVQRIWSNKSAAAGRDPCQPEAPGEVYHAAAPVLTQTVDYNDQGQITPVKGVKIAVGASATVPVEFFSEAPVASWKVTPYDYEELLTGVSYLDLELTPASGVNGTMGTLKITVKKAAPNNQELFLLVTPDIESSPSVWWVGTVVN